MKRVPLVVVLWLLVGCAQTPVVPEPSPAAPVIAAAPPPPATPLPEGRTVRNTDLGYTVDLPRDSSLTPARDRGLIAAAPDGTKISVFFEHLATVATTELCWARLFERVGAEMPDPPKSADQLRAAGQQGFVRGTRRVYLSAYPRAESCMVLAIDGPKESEVLASAAPLAMATFKPGEPSPAFAAKLALEAGAQLLDKKEFVAALRQFETALKGDEGSQVRAHFGAGLAAYFIGPETAAVTVDHLSRVVAARADPDRSPEDEIRQEQYRDALMYLGLAYASLKQFPHATSTLAELVERFPDDAIGRYNFACVLALGGDADAALDELRTALHRDPELTEHAKKDDDLKSLHLLPAWRALLGEGAAPPDAAAN